MNAVLVTLLLGLQAPGQEVAPTTEPVVAPELLDWSDGLTLADLDAREAFLDGILADARRSPERCEELTLWLTTVAAGSDDLAWTARLAKRELQRSPFGDPLLGLLGGEHQVDVLFVGTTEGLAEDLSITFEATPGDLLPSGVDASTGEGMEELEAWAKGVVEHTNRFPVANLSSLGDWTLELRMGPDWTQLRLKEAPEPVLEVDGGSEGQLWLTRVREYNGRTLADIVGRNPDLVGLLPFEVPGVVAGSSAPRTDILGVFTRKVGADLCSALGLEPGRDAGAGQPGRPGPGRAQRLRPAVGPVVR